MLKDIVFVGYVILGRLLITSAMGVHFVKQLIPLSIRKKIFKFLIILKKVPETIRFLCAKEKILLNVWIRLSNNKLEHFNLGDELNFYIIKAFSNKPIFNLPCILCKGHENIMFIGSIIETHTNKNSIIWGSGAMYGGDRNLNEHPKRVLAVRGPLTRKYLLSQGIDCPEIYGDPALLLPRLYKPQRNVKYKLGVIPHYIDSENEYLSELKKDNEVKIISLSGYEHWHNVIDEICQCDFIVSSSLHGLIISDAYGIPNMWIKLSNNISGGDFKYHDYFMSVNRTISKAFVINHHISKEELVKYKEQYQPIILNMEKFLEVSPF